MGRPAGNQRRGGALVEGAFGLAALAGVLAAAAALGPEVARPALEWAETDRSGAGVRPLSMRGVTWTLALPAGLSGELRARELRLAPRRMGPFALNTAREPELEDVELELVSPHGDAFRLRAPRARWREPQLVFQGGCVLTGPDGRELRGSSARWRRGSDRLAVEHASELTIVPLLAGAAPAEAMRPAEARAEEPERTEPSPNHHGEHR